MPAKPRIVLVDDDEDKRFILARRIHRDFPSVVLTACATAQSGLEALSEETPSLLITNGRIGQDDGLALVKQVRAEHPELPIMLLTLRNELAQKAIAAGATYFFDEAKLPEIREGIANALSHPSPR